MARLQLTALLVAVFHPLCARSQFGGAGGFGGGGYTPPAPKCPMFTCGKSEMPVGKVDHQIWSYGCKESGLSFLNTANFDPSNPMKGLQQKNVDKCCVERDICKQTCGMSAKACHDAFQKCSKKICKGDQNCDMQAMLSEMMSDPIDDKEDIGKKPYDPEETRCRGYNRGQKEACQCVAKSDWQDKTNANLKAFYSKFNPEKLSESGEIKDLDEVWKKWKGKEPEMFFALATKYKEKAVEIRVKPKPPPYKPPADSEDKAKEANERAKKILEEEAEIPSEGASTPEEEPEASSSSSEDSEDDAEGIAYRAKRRELSERKRKATEEEDYDLAESTKEELTELTNQEVARLKGIKSKAIEAEDYKLAKDVKAKIAKLEL